MPEYIATFHTHHAALVSQRNMVRQGMTARMMPVPRALSSSCGTCVRFSTAVAFEHLLHQDFEQVVLLDGEEYKLLMENE